MKKLKSKILILLMAIALPLASLLWGTTQTIDVYAKTISPSKLQNTATKSFEVDNLSWTLVRNEDNDYYLSSINLYSTGEDTLNYYTTSATFVGSNIYSSLKDPTVINVSDSSITLYSHVTISSTATYLVSTKVIIPSYIVGDSNYTLSLTAGSATCTMSMNDSGDTLNGSSLTSNEIEILYRLEAEYVGSSTPNSSTNNNIRFSLESPQLTITTDDVTAPNLTMLADSNVDKVDYRTINFNVNDNGTGISYIKYYKGTKDIHNSADEVTLGTTNGTYSFDANYAYDYTIEMSDMVGNIRTYVVSKDIDNTLNPSISNLKVSNRNKELEFTLNYTPNKIAHGAKDSIYYAILPINTYNDMVSTAGGDTNTLIDSIISVSLGTLTNTSNTLSISTLGKDSYIVLAVAKDVAGNRCNDIASSTFVFDPTKYTLNLPTLVGGNYSKILIDGEDYFISDTNEYSLDIYANEEYSISYSAQAGYKFFDVVVDNEEKNKPLGDTYTYSGLYAKENTIDAIFKYIINVDFDSEYTFNNTHNTLYNTLIDNFSLVHAGSLDVAKTAIEFEILDSENNMVATYNCDGSVSGEFYNVGTYFINWRIASDSADNYIQLDNSPITILVVPFNITDITYSGYENLIYTGNPFNLTFSLDNSNLTDDEKLTLLDYFTLAYFDISDSEKTHPMTSMLNAGTYFACITIDNDNYTIEANDILNSIVINKKVITVVPEDKQYTYNERVQTLDFTNTGDLDSLAFVVNFAKLIEESYVSSPFQKVGEYTYSISLASEYALNYMISEESTITGTCTIVPQDVYFVLNTSHYDYIGLDITVDFTVYNGADENTREIIISPNNVFSCVSVDGTSLREENVYTVTFESTDDGYILHLEGYEYTLEINKNTITIEMTNVEFEFDGTAKDISYTFITESGERFTSIVGLALNIYSEETLVSEVISVGEYTYQFVCQDGYVYDLVNSTGTIFVLPAIINVEIVEEYEYNVNPENLSNLENYSILYSLISTHGTDFKELGFISLQITKDDEDLTWGNVGEYNYSFTSTTSSVVFQLAEGTGEQITGTINIVPRNVTINITNTYTYSSVEQNLEYSIDDYYGLSVDEITLTIDTMLEANNYKYTFACSNSNYQLFIPDALIDNDDNYYVTILPKTIGIASIQNEYIYSGEDISVLFTLENPFDEDIEYTINRRLNGIIVDSIVNVGTYTFEIYSSNTNYSVDFGLIEIVVSPQALVVIVDENISKEYNRTCQTIDYTFKDSNNVTINVASRVVYTQDGYEVSPFNVGKYDYKIMLTNPNYSIIATVGKLTITPKTLVVTPLSSQSKVYGSDEPSAILYTLSGLIDGDEATVQLARAIGECVDLYAITYVEGSLTNDNYVVSFRENTYFFEITQKRLVVIADYKEQTFEDDDTPLTYKMYIGGILVDNLPNNDTLDGQLTRMAGSNVGEYDILIGNLNNDNYAITFVSNKFRIVPRDLHVLIDNISVTYGTSQSLTYVISENYNSEYVTGNLVREEGDNVDDYIISQGTLTSQNYNLIVTNGVYSITPKDAYVSANHCQKVYGDDDVLTYSVVGLINNDQLIGALTRTAGEDVGDYDISVGTLAHPNYNIIFTSNILTIEKAKLTIAFDNKSQVYGEKATPLTYTVLGMKNNETLSVRPFRESGDDVGEYEITGAFSIPNNYILENFLTGTYTIEKARLNLSLQAKTVTYNGKAHSVEVDNFEYPVKITYKLNGFEVNSCVNAGVYTAQAEFAGNDNYYPAKSKEVNLIIEKQYVFITILNSSFIYDDTIKYPEYSYDKNIGIDSSSFVFKFADDIFPQEEGEYNFAIIINDDNYEGQTQGIVKIQKPLTITNDKSSIIECENATFDDNAKNLKLVQNTDTKKFNNEKVLSVCTLENVSDASNGYIYTVRVKATDGVDNVKVYKVGLSGFSQQAIKIEDGYYVFKIDDPSDKYIITTEIKTLSTLAWILIIVAIVLVFSIALIIVARRKHKKAKATATKVSDKDIETYNVN